jgi:hypothetical protein
MVALGRRSYQVRANKSLGFAALLVVLGMTSGLPGCSLFSASNAPVDCDAVKNQEQAGYSDAKIAADLGATADQVAACHGPKTATGPQD